MGDNTAIQIVLSSATAIVGALSAAVIFLFRELSRKSEIAEKEITTLRAELKTERDERLEAAQALAQTSIDMLSKQAAIAEVVQRAHNDIINRRGGKL